MPGYRQSQLGNSPGVLDAFEVLEGHDDTTSADKWTTAITLTDK